MNSAQRESPPGDGVYSGRARQDAELEAYMGVIWS